MLQDELAKALDVSKGYLSKLIKKGCPADDIGKAKTWISAHTKPRAKRKKVAADPVSEAAKELPPVETSAPEPCETWEARLGRARKIERDIYEAAQATIGRKEYAPLSSLLASYQRALQGIAEAEQTALDIRKESGELIHRETAAAILAELLLPIRNALDLLPMSERTRCNPQSPEVAQEALTAWRDKLLRVLCSAETKF